MRNQIRLVRRSQLPALGGKLKDDVTAFRLVKLRQQFALGAPILNFYSLKLVSPAVCINM